jgi:uncharacterized protein (TIGR03435 family)
MLEGTSSDPLTGPLRDAGLTLQSRKSALDVIVVDSMSKTPTEN